MGVVNTRIIGGLGNQMFQYAAGFSLASRKGAALCLDLSGYHSYATWPYLLNRLRVPQDLVASSRRERAGSSFAARAVRRLRARGSAAKGTYREPHFHVDESFFDLEPPVTIEGYFQSPRYFAGFEQELRVRFQLAEPLGPDAAEYAERIREARCPVSVHVRRGDYLSGAAAGVYAQLGPAYYDAAIDAIRQISAPARPTFFVFSDEPELIAPQFTGVDAQIVATDPERPYDDMHLMARCRHHIIANSTFGWWGAWLDSSASSTVIAPSRWFSNEKAAEFRAADVYPSSWRVI